jgi:hypothetical protein
MSSVPTIAATDCRRERDRATEQCRPPHQRPGRGREHRQHHDDAELRNEAQLRLEPAPQQQRGDARRDHRGHRQRVEHVLDRQGGEGGSQRHAVADERDLGGLAHQRPERCRIAERVATHDGHERVGEPQRMRRLEALDPRRGARREAEAGDGDDRDEAPAHLPQSDPDLLRPRDPDDPDQQDDANSGRHDGGHRTALGGGHAQS